MRIIFLDFDGVINNCGDEDDYVFYPVKEKNGRIHNLPFSAENIKPLKELISFSFKNDIKFVLSTSWRELISFSEINIVFKNFFGFNYLDFNLVIDETPLSFVYEEIIRGNEIKKYLEKNPRVEDYLIIDDNYDFLDEQNSHVIIINPIKGFSEKDLKKVKKYFY